MKIRACLKIIGFGSLVAVFSAMFSSCGPTYYGSQYGAPRPVAPRVAAAPSRPLVYPGSVNPAAYGATFAPRPVSTRPPTQVYLPRQQVPNHRLPVGVPGRIGPVVPAVPKHSGHPSAGCATATNPRTHCGKPVPAELPELDNKWLNERDFLRYAQRKANCNHVLTRLEGGLGCDYRTYLYRGSFKKCIAAYNHTNVFWRQGMSEAVYCSESDRLKALGYHLETRQDFWGHNRSRVIQAVWHRGDWP